MQQLTPTMDPIAVSKLLWPVMASIGGLPLSFYKQQQEIIYSVWHNDETFVPAGNMLGKDFVAGFIALTFFLTRQPCRVLTTSVDSLQLEGVLWGEIRRFINDCAFKLDSSQGGPLLVNHLHIRRVDPSNGQVDGLSYILGRMAARGEGMLGHHIAKIGDGIPRTLCIIDEASGVEDKVYENVDTWAERKLIIGNCYPPIGGNNFWKRGVKGGDIIAKV